MHFKLYLLKEAEYKVDTIAIQRFYPFKWAISKFKYIYIYLITAWLIKFVKPILCVYFNEYGISIYEFQMDCLCTSILIYSSYSFFDEKKILFQLYLKITMELKTKYNPFMWNVSILFEWILNGYFSIQWNSIIQVYYKLVH